MNDKKSEVAKKHKRLQDLAEKCGLDGFCISRAINFMWYTAGGTNRVVTASETGCAALVVLKDKTYIVAPRNEMKRLMEEQVVGLGFVPHMHEWYESREQIISELIGSQRVGSDIPFGKFPIFAGDINRLRYSLTTEEVARARLLGEICSRETVATCLVIQPGMTEWEIADQLSSRLQKVGVRSAVLLVGTDDRALNHRHPVPTGKKLDKYAIIALVAEQGGLNITLTRAVHFGPVPEQLANFFEVALNVEQAFLNACASGADSQVAFDAGVEVYCQAGLPDEWKLHHQGGTIGYQPREYRAGEGSPEIFQDNQMLGWNPTVQGTKTEDTVLYKKDGSLEFLTTVPSWWPTTIKIIGGEHVRRPLILER